MDFENFTDRARGFIQSAQTLALRTNHQQLTPLHVLKILLEDKEGSVSYTHLTLPTICSV